MWIAGSHPEGDRLNIATCDGALGDFKVEFVLVEGIFEEWSKTDNRSRVPHGRNIIFERDHNPFTGDVEVHLNFYSPECLLGAEEGRLDGKLKEEGAPRITLADFSAGTYNNVIDVVTHLTGLFVLKAEKG